MKKPEPVDDPPKAILLAGHLVSHAIRLKGFPEQFDALTAAKEQLVTLSQRDEWWVRLYVAEVMRRHAELHIPAVLETLRADDNAVVTKAAKSFKP